MSIILDSSAGVTTNSGAVYNNISRDTTNMQNGAGGVTLSGVLDRVIITTANGTDTFDAGSINILYE
jgi:hypothetical protein